jgi:hypothetical protein
MKRRLGVLVVFSLLLIGNLFGATIEHEQVTDGTVASPAYTILPWLGGTQESIALPEFDTSLGTLTQVNLTLRNFLEQDFTVQNTSGSSVNVTVRAGARFYWNNVRDRGTDNPENNVQFNTGTQNYSIGETKSWLDVRSDSEAGDYSYTDSDDLSFFTGTGNFTVTIWNEETTEISGDTSNMNVSISGIAYAYAKVVYTYDSPVPVNLSAFYANYIGGIPTIYWTTQSEENNDYWNVYRGTSQDFVAAHQINAQPVPGNGTTNYASDYIFTDSTPVVQNTTYWYWIEDVATDGETTIHEPITLEIPYEDTPVELDIYGLEQNYPNPFNPSTSISFSLEEYSEVELTIYNMNGQKIKDLEVVRTGLNGTALWDGTDENSKPVSSGVYLYKLTTDNKVYQKKMLLVK